MYNNWLVFKDTYSTLIHDNTELSSIEKFHYLKAAVTDDAAKIINKIILSADGYQSAWASLLARYDNQRMLIDTHVKGLFNLKQLSEQSSSHLLHALIDDYTIHLRALNSLNQPVDHWDTILIHLITTRLDNESFKQWELQLNATCVPTLKQLTDFLVMKEETS